MQLVLASSSPYRRELLSRLRIDFIQASPDVDETPLAGESPGETSSRLALKKAQVLAKAHPDALIIGADQVALLEGKQIGKPGHHDKAVQQLTAMRGKTLSFHTAVCLYNSRNQSAQQAIEITELVMRDYSDAEIERYLRLETPYDCAGSAKSDGLGITLIQAIRGDDPTGLIGLPLIKRSAMLRNEGMLIP